MVGRGLVTIILLLVLATVLPVTISGYSRQSFTGPAISASSAPRGPGSSKRVLYTLATKLCGSDCSTRALGTVTVLVGAGCGTGPSSFGTGSFLCRRGTSKDVGSICNRVGGTTRDTGGGALHGDDRTLFIPCSRASGNAACGGRGCECVRDITSP